MDPSGDDHRPEMPLTGPIALFVTVFLKIPSGTSKKKAEAMRKNEIKRTKRPDSDNYLKQIMDAMTRLMFWDDDSQVWSVVVVKRYDDGKGPRWEIELKEER